MLDPTHRGSLCPTKWGHIENPEKERSPLGTFREGVQGELFKNEEGYPLFELIVVIHPSPQASFTQTRASFVVSVLRKVSSRISPSPFRPYLFP